MPSFDQWKDIQRLKRACETAHQKVRAAEQKEKAARKAYDDAWTEYLRWRPLLLEGGADTSELMQEFYDWLNELVTTLDAAADELEQARQEEREAQRRYERAVDDWNRSLPPGVPPMSFEC